MDFVGFSMSPGLKHTRLRIYLSNLSGRGEILPYNDRTPVGIPYHRPLHGGKHRQEDFYRADL